MSEISRALRMTRKSVLKWIDKALPMGVKTGIRDTPHKPREAVITDDAKAWVVHLACSKPKDLEAASTGDGGPLVITVSVDEKPGVQAIA